MSTKHYIKYKRHLNMSRFENFISGIDGAKSLKKGGGLFYFWIEGKSTRGVELTLENGQIEIRNTTLSNTTDYELTNAMVKEVLSLTDGSLFNEDEEEITDVPLYTINYISRTENHDVQLFSELLARNHDVSIFGPRREVYFGKRLYAELKGLGIEELKEKIYTYILNVNYNLPEYEMGTVMQVSKTEDDKKYLKLLTNKSSMIITKYDYIALDTMDGNPIIITNDILNTMLPWNWKLVDEYTVVAPITNKDEWIRLLADARKADLWNEFASR